MEHLAQSEDPQIRAEANASLASAEEIRASRAVLPATPSLGVRTALPRRRYREVYDAHQTRQLPGELVRSEGEAPVDDVAVNEVYDFSGDAYDFYDEVFQLVGQRGDGADFVCPRSSKAVRSLERKTDGIRRW